MTERNQDYWENVRLWKIINDRLKPKPREPKLVKMSNPGYEDKLTKWHYDKLR